MGRETIKELEHISIGMKTNISNTSNIHNLSRQRAAHCSWGSWGRQEEGGECWTLGAK